MFNDIVDKTFTTTDPPPTDPASLESLKAELKAEADVEKDLPTEEPIAIDRPSIADITDGGPVSDDDPMDTKEQASVDQYQGRDQGTGSTGDAVGGTGTAAAADTSAGQTGYGSCFIAGTQITMANGTFKNIEDVVVGDKVKGHKEDNTVIKLDPTLLADRKLYSFNDNEHYFFTSEHPFMTEEGWKSIKPEKTKERDGVELYNQLKGELKIGDKLETDRDWVF